MKIIRIALHALVLMVADLAGIGIGGLLAFRLTGTANQVWLQLPIAVILSIGLFFAWMFALRIFRITPLQPRRPGELGCCLLISLVWGIVVLVPLHYVTQGYLTSIGNIVALALYQLPINAIALFGSAPLAKPVYCDSNIEANEPGQTAHAEQKLPDQSRERIRP